jgi:hypothetical protein
MKVFGRPSMRATSPRRRRRARPAPVARDRRAPAALSTEGATSGSTYARPASSLRELAGPPSDGLTPEKAQQILDDGSVRGYTLTDRQRRFMAARAHA